MHVVCMLVIVHAICRALIVYIGVSPLLKTPLFLAKPPLNLQTVHAPFLGNPPLILVIHEPTVKVKFFSETPK